MDDRVASLEGGGDGRHVEHVSGDHVVGRERDAVRAERLGDLFRPADQEPDAVSVPEQGQHHVGADVAGAPVTRMRRKTRERHSIGKKKVVGQS